MSISDRESGRRPGGGAEGAKEIPSTRHRFVAAVARSLDRRCGVRPGDRLIAAVSGGADSLALLLALTALARRSHRAYHLTVAHVNHHLRAEAQGEAEQVRIAAESLGLECVVCDVDPLARGGNLAAQARRLRYESLAEVAHRTGAAALLTAHHGTDQLETVLLALVRGAGPDGLAALAWRSTRWGIDIVRPLLDRTHQECIDLCGACGWKWSEDPSNLDIGKRRNAVRARLLPLVLSLAPGLDRRIHRTTDLLRESATLIEREVDRVFTDAAASEFSRAALASAGELIVGAGLRRAAARLGSPLDELTREVVRPAVDAIMDTATRAPRLFQWPGGVRIDVRAKVVCISGAAT